MSKMRPHFLLSCRHNHDESTQDADVSEVKIPEPTWSIKDIYMEHESDMDLSEEEMQAISKRCLIRIDEDDVELRKDLKGFL